MGLGRFSECGLVNCLLWLRKQINNRHQHQITIHQHLQPSCKLTTSSVSVNRVFQVERAVCSSLVCLCYGSVYCAITSMPDELEVCQHARGSSRCSSRCPESPDVVPLCQMAAVPVSQDCTHGSVFLFVMMILIDFSLMWWPIGCVCHHFIV